MVMQTNSAEYETDLLRALRPQYESKGYTFFIHPTSDLIPPFLRGYRPDAIAVSEKDNVVIEGEGSQSAGKANVVFRKSPNW